MSIEVLICTHNRAGLLKQALTHINQAIRPPDANISIFVAANNCSDATIRLLKLYSRHTEERRLLHLRYIEVPDPGKSNALNEAIPQLEGDLIACVDDDHRVDKNFFKGILTASVKQSGASIFCGKILPDWDGSEPRWVHETGTYRIYPLPVPKFDQGDKEFAIKKGTVTPGGGNLVIRSDVFSRVGTFDRSLGPTGHNLGGGEDIDWVKRALELGENLFYAPQIVQFHYVDGERLTTSYVVRKAYGRTLSTMKVRNDIPADANLPLYMIRKLAEYFYHLVFSYSRNARRYYLVRTTAALAEIVGFLQNRREGDKP